MAQRVELPDGNIAEFPDGMQAAEIEAVLQKQFPAQQPKPNAIVDTIRALPGGLAKGGAALAGLPGDIEALLTSGADWALGKAGVDIQGLQKSREALRAQSPIPQLPTSQGINRAISEPFGGYYEPQTTAGQYAETIAEFAPAALAPGSAAQRAMRVISPAILSETGGQASKGTPYEPYMRAGGALIGGIGQGLGEARIAARANPTPSAADLKAAANAAYKTADESGLVVAQQPFKQAVARIAAEADAAGLDPTLHPKATAVLNRLATFEGDPSLQKLETLRRVVKGAAGSIEKDERRIARIIQDGLDDFVENLDESAVIAGDAEQGVSALKEARGLWSKLSKNDVIDNAIQKAKDRASQFSGSGYENALRTEFRKISMNDRAMRRFSKEEQDAIRKVVQGTPAANALRMGGKLAPTGVVSGGVGASGGAAIGSMIGGPAGAIIGGFGVPALGAASRAGATALTSRNAQLAAELMRRGAPMPQTQGNASLIADLLLSQQGAR